MTKKRTCKYCSPDGWQCDEPAGESGLCYWHDPDIDKSKDEDVKDRVEQWAKDGKPLDGFQLSRAKLEDINLVNRGCREGYKCRDVDFYRADLRNAHFFGLDLRGSSLMKSTLAGANLHCAKLENCNLLGADLSRARLENVEWGEQLQQERKAMDAISAKDTKKAVELCQEAEEVARCIRKQCEKEGLFEIAGHFFKKEMIFRRYQMPLYSSKRIISKGVDLFCGYGESPIRVVMFSVCLIFMCALAYFFLGTTASNPIYPDVHGYKATFLEFLNALYFSVVTFTTLGYGDISPIGLARFIAAFEAFLGSFTMALFVVVFVKKMTR
ncbi:putative Pentapeptide super family protein [Vibrio nigripulchritudo MADA3029]|uniref:Pentapeptide super family protein n=2 Tax=Vibrio nigripulchritudo TaxID=28173 RepID=A0AAV2VWU6_9VIBR|nr:ion channel [Vibrio nigripulchritudo]CCN46366.1 putative Pentapeptide super family protein [Vibrio nigripulchritudo MADA3020]CCN53436.1 putative Pentapeptide super family protein [Vibrio nigripulchritudo MADA3021]CCN58389.1 putative Pentapeptide super family protein [Vibrio nigripulchritudo MADA3029]CCN68537.1 putative Pentapeptide super family protein [Vibrio nigripulchritudo SFn118]CCN82278.1 putative Pentapeptide super family protein [Vibrio nigripulchritudo BLFn1]